MSNDMFTDGLVEYLIRHQHCDVTENHGPQCPDHISEATEE